MVLNKITYLALAMLLHLITADHFRGGILSWRPLNKQPTGSTVQVQIYQRYFWNRQWGGYSIRCTAANVVSKTLIPVNDRVYCYVNCSSSTFPSTGISTVVTSTDCDQNPLVRSWAGERYDTLTLPLTTSITIGYSSTAWFGPNLFPASGLPWSLANRINLAFRPDGYINTSPVTNTLPVLFKPVGQQLVHIVQMSDNDGTDILKCRWANSNSGSNYNRRNECMGACLGLNGFSTLYSDNCTLVFTLPNTRIGWYYVVALQIEDYYDSTSTTPMSSVPVQFLFYAYSPSTSCTTRPVIIGDRPNRACIGTPINVTITERVVAQTFCTGTTISNYVTSSPYGMQHSTVVGIGTGLYAMTLTWTPEDRQYGPQGFCAGAVDNNNLQSDAWCVTYLVGFDSPDLIRTKAVQGSASPLGTIFSNHTLFSIQATRSVNRPTRNGTYIRFMDATTNTAVQTFDAGWEPNVVYTGITIVIVTNYTWIAGRSYYVLFDSGVASGVEFCGPESAPITDPNFWVFNIWDPGLSSTTTTTTTPPTTVTVTTRAISTTTVNTLLTTTGLHVTTATTVTTTTSETTTTTSTTSVTTSTVTPATSAPPEVSVISAKDFEEACKQPVAIMTVCTFAVFLPLQAVGMFAMFTKLFRTFDSNHIQAALRNKQRLRKLTRM